MFFLYPYSKETELIITIKGITSLNGKLQVAVFRAKDEFPTYGKQFKGKIVEVKSKTMRVTFDDLPPDTYAIAVYHDANGNYRLDKNFVGAPTERYGFSNNARRTFSAPSFEEAAFILKSEKEVEIELK